MKRFFTQTADLKPLEILESGPDGVNGKPRAMKVRARVYRTGRNKNYVRFDEGELEQFAASFVGRPFLQDHSRKQADRAGTILESVLENDGDEKVIRQTLLAVKPWAIDSLSDGTMDRFSIGWDAEEYVCTVCDADIFGCKHGPFAVGSKDKKTGETVEVLMRGLEGMEVSAVTHPAVGGTGIDEVLSQLQQISETASGRSGRSFKEDEMLDRLKQLLGLAADTAEPEALAALETRLTAPLAVPAGLLTALGLGAEATTDEAIAKAYTLVPREDLEAERKKVAEAKADELIRQGKAAGKITPAMEAWATEFAKRDSAEFEKCLATMPVQFQPAAAPPATEDPKKTNPHDEDDAEAARLAGLSVENYRKGKQEFLTLLKGGR
jgi:hypothetical protein